MTIPLFKTNPNIMKPYALMDLDDTLFQTQRKIDAWDLPTTEPESLVCATVNKQDEPLSFMSQRQAALFNWLLASTDLIVVTARDRSEIKRVKLPFDSWQVLTHGAIILSKDGKLQAQWQQHMHSKLTPLQDKLNQLSQLFANHSKSDQNHLVFTPHIDSFHNGSIDEELTIYLAIKHAQKDHQALVDLAAKLPTLIRDFEQDFYVHVNANNLAILPHAVHKRHAVQFLLEHHLDHQRPSFGFGDSLADLPFLQLLDWYGMPNHGQLHEQYQSKPSV
ncbi:MULTISPECIES: HAD hydrolase family protein [unclassified Psychrobacter]|uniref:HAD hydrolase family protein n=1 Tax=unclassified Psychrobacter TaxID=196806 RepID=UPI0025B56060|nr:MULTISPECIES: HAD hydrolase family protein [unclassified Psychrobacter]MDN3453724.1 HAD hydrolase family protein [Psychrobacter sp. APC 3350]MDN3502199.1 HAD hydrolase family protein [Psychrobacter sp. 5A.1]